MDLLVKDRVASVGTTTAVALSESVSDFGWRLVSRDILKVILTGSLRKSDELTLSIAGVKQG